MKNEENCLIISLKVANSMHAVIHFKSSALQILNDVKYSQNTPFYFQRRLENKILETEIFNFYWPF